MHYTTSDGRFFDEPPIPGTYGAIERSTQAFWRDMDTIDVSRVDVFDKAEFSWKEVASRLKLSDFCNLTAASPHINRGALVAKVWEEYVGAMPDRRLFDYEEKLAKEFLAPLEYTKAPEQPYLGLFNVQCETEGHLWAVSRMQCDRCGIRELDLRRY